MDVATEKSQTETYTLRWKGGCWWAIFYVDAAHGALSVQSDFGDYSYRWGSPSKPFKKFLAEIGVDYLMDKLSSGNNYGKYFYADKSVTRLQEAVGKLCDEQHLPPEERIKYEEAIDTIEGFDCHDGKLFFHLAYTNDDLSELFNNDPHAIGDCVVNGYSPHLMQFAEKIWPSFVAVLKQELDAKSSEP